MVLSSLYQPWGIQDSLAEFLKVRLPNESLYIAVMQSHYQSFHFGIILLCLHKHFRPELQVLVRMKALSIIYYLLRRQCGPVKFECYFHIVNSGVPVN